MTKVSMDSSCPKGQTGYISSPCGKPMDRDFPGGAKMEGLCRNLSVAVDNQGLDVVDGKNPGVRFLPFDFQGLPGFADPGLVTDDVNRRSLDMGREKAHRFPVLILGKPLFFRQADRGKGALDASALVFGNRGARVLGSEEPTALQRVSNSNAQRVV